MISEPDPSSAGAACTRRLAARSVARIDASSSASATGARPLRTPSTNAASSAAWPLSCLPFHRARRPAALQNSARRKSSMMAVAPPAKTSTRSFPDRLFPLAT